MSEPYGICVRVDDDFAGHVPTCLLRQAIALTMERGRVPPDTGVTLLVTDDEAMRRLNHRFLGIDAPTDVLAFPVGEDDMPGAEDERYLGDIIVAYPYAATCAAEDGHDLAHVLVLLAVHGTLHLLGLDHDTAENQRAMWAAQEDILRALNVPTEVIPPLPDSYAGDAG